MMRLEMENYNTILTKKATEISALSSRKIDKYEYLTGEEILPSNQKQIIEQAKLTYSPLGKITTIEDQGENQIKVIQNQGSIKTIKKYAFDDEDSPFISKQKEIFHELADKRIQGLTDLDKKVNLNDLMYRYKGSTSDTKFDKFDHAFNLLDKIRKGKVRLTDLKTDQIKI